MPKHISERKLEKWLLDNIEEDFRVNVTMKPKQKRESPKKYKDRLKRLNDIYLMENISESDYKKAAQSLQLKIAELSKEPTQKEVKFTANWKELYNELDAEHRRAFWRNIIKGVKIDENGTPVEILY